MPQFPAKTLHQAAAYKTPVHQYTGYDDMICCLAKHSPDLASHRRYVSAPNTTEG